MSVNFSMHCTLMPGEYSFMLMLDMSTSQQVSQAARNHTNSNRTLRHSRRYPIFSNNIIFLALYTFASMIYLHYFVLPYVELSICKFYNWPVANNTFLIVVHAPFAKRFIFSFSFDCYSGAAPFLPDSPATWPVPLPCGVHQRYPMNSSIRAETVLKETLPGQFVLPWYCGQRP